MCRDHDDLRVAVSLFQGANEFQSRHAGHTQVSDDHVEGCSFQVAQGGDRAGAAANLMAGAGEHFCHGFPRCGVVIDHQNFAG